MVSKEEKIRRLKTLSRTEMEVVYYFCQGLNDDEICLNLGGITIKALNSRRTGVYKVLGIDVPNKDKQNFLSDEYSKLIPEVCPNEEALKRWRPTKSEEKGNDFGENEKKPRRSFVLPLVIAVLIIILFAAVGVGGYILGGGERTAPQITDSTVATQEILTLAPSATLLPASIPTETLLPTPTFTLAPTFTPLPTETPKAYYSQGEAVTLKSNVVAYMDPSFNAINDSCAHFKNDFGLRIQVVNNSTDQFLLRFNSNTFHATDDQGTEYQLVGSGMPNWVQPPGIDINFPMSSHYQKWICVLFKGQIPLKATYLLITADWISGVEHIIFRKDI